ncbi:hypothetical protein LC605_15955 [Nostoc sp. CHAB 5836]|uniref:hypothetical protein n=1 Tax=Nostoc sp. CHAB 5836 TaxID=2780404 RepID=UPI001E3CB475|nr:hypothetical protein [Nostoc sp. CHAB 5836]MCC5616539.1 hypothetical protein [Nostoc sp. CHAB 5836]
MTIKKSSELDSLINCFVKAYESSNSVSYETLCLLDPLLSNGYRRRVDKALSIVKQKYGYDFHARREGKYCRYYPLCDASMPRSGSRVHTFLLVTYLQEAHRARTFVDYKTIKKTYPDAYIVDAIKKVEKRGYYFDKVPGKGYCPVQKKNFISREPSQKQTKRKCIKDFICLLKTSYESKKNIDYESLIAILPEIYPRERNREYLNRALREVKEEYGYKFQHLEGKGYQPIYDETKQCCECGESFPSAEAWEHTINNQYGISVYCSDCQDKYYVHKYKKTLSQSELSTK